MATRLLDWLAGDRQPADATTSEDPAQTFLLGLVTVTTVASLVSLVHPLDLRIHITISLLLLALAWRSIWRFIRSMPTAVNGLRRFAAIGAAGIVSLGVLVFAATAATRHYDTGLYHAQMVQWNKVYGVVPGLANLQGRLGFNSAWDVFAAFLDQGYFNGRSFHVVELVITAIFLIISLQGFIRLGRGDRSLGTILRCLGMIVLLFGYRSVISSLSTDWPSALLLYYLVIRAAETLDRKTVVPAEKQLAELGGVTMIAAFAITVKLSTLLIVLLPLLWLTRPPRARALVMLVVPIVCVTGPFILRNIVLTGYLVYPFAALDLFGFDWEVPSTDVHLMSTIIRYWAINPVPDWYLAKDMEVSQQIQTWLRWRGNQAIEFGPLLLAGLLGWACPALLRRGRAHRAFAGRCVICCILLAGIAFCLVSAPEPRFASGWFLAFGLFACAWMTETLTSYANFTSKFWLMATNVLLICSTLWMIRIAGLKRLMSEGAPLWELNELPSVPLKEVTTEKAVTVKVPVEGDRAWNAPLPSTPSMAVNPWLEMRGSTLKDGFRVTKPGFGIGRESLEHQMASTTRP